MYEDTPKELHELRKKQLDKLKKARKDGKRAFFIKAESDKLYIDGKYVKLELFINMRYNLVSSGELFL